MSLGKITRAVRCACKRFALGGKPGDICAKCQRVISESDPVSYFARIKVEGVRRQKVYRSFGQAEKWLKEQRTQKVEVESGAIERGRSATKRGATYKDVADELKKYLDAKIDRERSTLTIRGYKSELKSLLVYWGPKLVIETTEGDIAAWVAKMRADGRATSTIRNRLGRLSQIHKQAVRLGYLKRKPCEVTLPRTSVEVERTPIPEETLRDAVQFAEESEDRRILAALLLAADAGLRLSDLAILYGEDIDLKAVPGRCLGWIRITVRDAKRRTKSGKGRMAPILSARLRSALEALPRAAGKPLFFPMASREGVWKMMAPMWAGIGSPSLLHSCRHRANCWWQGELSVPPAICQQWLGHKRLETTQIYTHLSPEPPDGTVDFEVPAAESVTPMLPHPSKNKAENPKGRVVNFPTNTRT